VFLSDNGPDPADPFDITSSKYWVKANYTTDGPDLGQKGTFSANGPRWAGALAAPWSGFKYFAAEGGLRVPLIISGAPGAVHDRLSNAFTTVKDIVPTLMDIAGISGHGDHYRGRPVVSIDGRSMLPLLNGRSDHVYGADEPVGYELAGSAALYRGHYKLVKNIAPLGDNVWRLYDMALDPGETHDLSLALPALMSSMQADYAAYAKNNNVLPIPDDFDLHAAARHYAVHHFLLPKLRSALPTILALLTALVALVWWLKRKRRAGQET